jgi:MSHA biogenesis protein MshJ
MNSAWTKLSARIDAATLRERVMIFGALAVLVLALADTLLFGPELARQKRFNRDIAQRQADIAGLQEQVAKLVEARQSSPERAQRARLEQLRTEIERTEAAIAEEQRRFTRPDQMRVVLEQMISKHRNVALLDLRTLQMGAETKPPAGDTKAIVKPAAPAAEAKGGARSAPVIQDRTVYRHALELTVAGRYLDLLAYVDALEKMPTRLYWGGAELDASQYPMLQLKLKVFTLSLDKSWMNV